MKRTATELSNIQKFKNIMREHNIQVSDDSRTLTLINPNAVTSSTRVTRHKTFLNAVEHVLPLTGDDRLRQFV